MRTTVKQQSIMIVLLGIVCAVLGLGTGVVSAELATGECTEVIDGDTVVVEIDGESRRIDIADVDAPELDQVYGVESREFLAQLALGKTVELSFRGDQEPAVARMHVDGVRVSLALLESGMAWTGDTEDETLIVAAIRARGEGKGLWHDERPIPPAVWRQRKPPEPTPTPAEVAHKLSDVGRKIELRKGADGKAVIAGLPMISPDDEEGNEDNERPALNDLKDEFQCPPGGLDECVTGRFTSRFPEAYAGDSAGSYTAIPSDQGEGRRTFVFQGTSSMSRSYAVGCACHCPPEADACQCVMQFGKLEKAEQEKNS